MTGWQRFWFVVRALLLVASAVAVGLVFIGFATGRL